MPVEPQKKATPKKSSTRTAAEKSEDSTANSETPRQPDPSSRDSQTTSASSESQTRASRSNDSSDTENSSKPPLGRENPQDSAVVNHPADPLHPEDPGILPASPFTTLTETNSLSTSPLDRNVPRTVAASDPGALDDVLKAKREQESAVSFAEANRDLVSASSAASSLLGSALDRAERHERRRENADRMNEKRVKETELLARDTGDATFDSPVNMRRALDQL